MSWRIIFDMTDTELLKAGRDQMLSLHKSLVDFERALYEGMYGKVTSSKFLTLLLEDSQFAWLRRFSALIVDIDEMFAQKDGFTEEAVQIHLAKMREIAALETGDETFLAKYQAALQQDMDASSKHGDLKRLLD